MRYILYARKSSESEDRQVQSLGDQLRTLRELARQRGLNVIDEVTEARSAKDPGVRPLFGEMLERIERGEADAILCWSINRLSRNPMDSGRLNWLLQQGVLKSIRTVDREYLPEDNVLLMAVESGVANQYILDLRKAVIRGMEGKAARGWFPGQPPQGYRVSPESREIEPKEPQFGMLRRAWDLLLTGAYPVRQIRQELWNWGYTAAKPGSERRMLAESSMYRVFDNPFYYGQFVYRGQRYEGKHPPMVTRDEFEQGQRILHGEMHVQPKRHEFAFTGLMRCGSCGCQITAERKIKTYRTVGRTVAYEYYRCTRRRGRCSEPAVTGQFVEAAIARQLHKVSIDPAFGGWLLNVLERDWNERKDQDQSVDSEQATSERAIEAKHDRLIELRLSNELTKEEFLRHRSELERQRQSIRSASESERTQRISLRNAITFGVSATKRFEADDLKLKRQIARIFATGYVLTQGELRITPHPLLARIAALEPAKQGREQVGELALRAKSPIEWAYRDNIRTLLSEEFPPFDACNELDVAEDVGADFDKSVEPISMETS